MRAIVAQNEESWLRKELTWNNVKKLGFGRTSRLDTGPYGLRRYVHCLPESKSRRKKKLHLDDIEQR